MKNNEPEILGYCAKRDRKPWERSNTYYLSPNPDKNYTVPVIRLSDYEVLQAKCNTLVNALELAQGFLRNKGHSEEDPFLLGAIDAALAPYRKGEES